MNKMYYHFVSSTLRDGSPIPADGEWLSVDGQIELCARGLHASEYVADAVRYAPGTTLCLVELDGEIIKGNDKLCARKRKIIARLDATVLLRKNACESALSVAHLWKMPAIVRQYLETQDESIRVEAHKTADAAAAYAAASAADAADAAAYAAASAAAYAAYAASAAAAAADSQRIKFLTDLLDEYDRITGRTQPAPVTTAQWTALRDALTGQGNP